MSVRFHQPKRRRYRTLQTIFDLCIPRRLSQASFPKNIKKKFAKQNFNIFSGIIIFCGEVGTELAACSHSAVSIGNISVQKEF
jgi:hypothetical protein